MTENEFVENIIKLKKERRIYIGEELHKEFEKHRIHFESSPQNIKELKKKIVNLSLDNNEKIFDRDFGDILNSTDPCIILQGDWAQRAEILTLSDSIVTLVQYQYNVMNFLAYMHSFSYSENTQGIRWEILEKIEERRVVNITYQEFLCLKTGEFAKILKELITGDHGEKLLEANYIEKLQFLSGLYSRIKDGIVFEKFTLKNSFVVHTVAVDLLFSGSISKRSTINVMCNTKEYAKIKLLM